MKIRKKIKRSILRHMYFDGRIGKHHIRLETAVRCGIPNSMRGLAKKTIETLIKEGLILVKKKSKNAISLNPKEMQCIEKELGVK